jgi:3-carboxy-cis,cis-muconate cycloisomerase
MAESLSMALATHLGKQQAHHVVQAACERAVREGTDLGTIAYADERISSTLSPTQIASALDPAGYLGSADLFVDRALAAFRSTVLPVAVSPSPAHGGGGRGAGAIP